MLQIYSPSCSTTAAAAADVLFPGRMEKPLQARQPQQAHGTRGMEHLPPALQPTGICARPVPSPGHSWKAKLRGSSSGAAQRGLKIQALLRGCFHFHGVAVCPIPGHCSWQAEDTLPGAGMTSLRLAYTHPQHLSQEKSHPCLLTALQLFETASLPVQTDPGGSFNSCSFTIKPGNQNRAIIHGGVFGNVISNSFWLADVQKDALLAASLCHERHHSAPILAGPRSPQWPHNTLKAPKWRKRGISGSNHLIILLSKI